MPPDTAGRVHQGRSVGAVAVAAGAIAACLAAGVMVFLPSRGSFTGIADAGLVTELSLPAVKAVYDLAGIFTVGWLLAAAVLVPPQRSGVLDVGGYRAMRAGCLSAFVWAAAALALVPVSVSDLVGQDAANPAAALNPTILLSALSIAELPPRGYLVTAGIALLIGVLGRTVLRPLPAAGLLVLAVAGFLPLALSGHASSNGDHDVAVDTMIFHLVGISVWIGGLLALLGLARQRVPRLDVVARRYSGVALIAFALVAVSGLGNTWVRLDSTAALWSTAYGRLILIKASLLVALGVFGYLHRRRTLPGIERGDQRAFIKLATVEVVVMATTVGVAVALGRTAPPPSAVIPSPVAQTLGFDLPGPPTAWLLLTDWRFDYLLGAAAVVAAGLYLTGVRRLHRRGDRWPAGRTVAWLLGCLLVVVATSSGLGRYAPSQFSIHMLAHMILGMCAPIMLALGGVSTLALRVLPAAGPGDPPGLREFLVTILNSRLTRILTHPLVVLPLFVGSFYAIYFTGLFEILMSSHLGHVAMNAHFLLVGYLYYWVIIGVDPTPRRLPHIVKLGILLAAVPFHSFFGLALMNSHTAMASNYYLTLDLPWAPDLVADQRLGGAIAWGITEIPMLIVMIALLAQWANSDDRENRRTDRRKDLGNDPALDAYNAMLAALAHRDNAGPNQTNTNREDAPAPDPAHPGG